MHENCVKSRYAKKATLRPQSHILTFYAVIAEADFLVGNPFFSCAFHTTVVARIACWRRVQQFLFFFPLPCIHQACRLHSRMQQQKMATFIVLRAVFSCCLKSWMNVCFFPRFGGYNKGHAVIHQSRPATFILY